MRLSQIVMVYFMIGAVMFVGTGGQFAASDEVNSPVEFFFDTDNGVNVSDTVTEGEEPGASGMLDNLLGPVQEGQNSVFGGGLIGGIVNFVLVIVPSMLAYPLVITTQVGAPREIQIIAGALTVAMVMATAQVLRASI